MRHTDQLRDGLLKLSAFCIMYTRIECEISNFQVFERKLHSAVLPIWLKNCYYVNYFNLSDFIFAFYNRSEVL